MLEINAGLGTLVREHDEIAAISPAPDALVSRDDLRRAHSAVRPRRESRSERQLQESAAALVEMASSLAIAGNEGAAHRVCDELLRLFDVHLRAVSAARGEAEDDVPPPMSLTVRTLGQAIGSGLQLAVNDVEREVFPQLVQSVSAPC